MTKTILTICGTAGVAFFIFWAGGKIAAEKCENTNLQNMQIQSSEITKIKREINDKTFKTATADIRSFLRENYTVAD